jgi:hypothetical protein
LKSGEEVIVDRDLTIQRYLSRPWLLSIHLMLTWQ